MIVINAEVNVRYGMEFFENELDIFHFHEGIEYSGNFEVFLSNNRSRHEVSHQVKQGIARFVSCIFSIFICMMFLKGGPK